MALMADLTTQVVAARVFAERKMPEYLERLALLVSIDSGPDSEEGRNRTATVLGEWLKAAGCEVELMRLPGGLHLVASLKGNGHGRITLVGHHDTVFPLGEARERPLRVDDGVAYGPGVADMKGGLLVGVQAIEALSRGPRS